MGMVVRVALAVARWEWWFWWPGQGSHDIDIICEKAVHHRLLPLLIAHPLLCCDFFLLQGRCQLPTMRACGGAYL